MNKLNFTPVDKAFTLGSSQIKDTQEEIDKLTKLILESNKISSKSGSTTKKQENLQPPEGPYGMSPSPSNYMRVGYPDAQTAVFRRNTNQDELDYNLMKVVGHPKFDDIVKNYALINHPEWFLKDTVYVPQTPNNMGYNKGYTKSYFGNNNYTKSYFGNKYQSTVCSDVKNYIVFFIISIVIFTLLSIYLK